MTAVRRRRIRAGLNGGRGEVAYRCAWARTYLKAAGLVPNSERGVWALTPEGAKAGGCQVVVSV